MTDPYRDLARRQRMAQGLSDLRSRPILTPADLAETLREAESVIVAVDPHDEMGPGVQQAAALMARLLILRLCTSTPSTASEDIATQQLLTNVGRRVREALAFLGVPLQATVVFGSIMSPTIEAEIRQVGVDEHGLPRFLVTFDRGIFDLLDRAAKAVARIVSVDGLGDTASDEEKAQAAEAVFDALRRFIRLMMAFVGEGKAHLAPRESVARFYQAEATICFAAETFVMAHEYGHVLLKEAWPGGGRLAEEREADLWGLAILMGSQFQFREGYLGIVMYFTVLALLEQARPGTYIDASHPRAQERLGAIRKALTSAFSAGAAENHRPPADPENPRTVLARVLAERHLTTEDVDTAMRQAVLVEKFCARVSEVFAADRSSTEREDDQESWMAE